MSPPLSVGDLPMASSFPVAYDISMLFDPEMQQPHAGATQQHPPPTVVHQRQQRQVDDDHFMEGCSPTSIARGGGNGGLEAIAGEFMLPYLGRPSPTSSAIGNPLFE
ncbi:hypothetical protein SAY86_020720 [Trapa natans]|uniref:Uncharacterized protein n=1 Tax=Trapa natans TaxID=22666 RepID=A0AAN7LN40_TRANT|nr:hypothetical protein SAY86_020720 [Trapa natans]